MNTFQKDKKYLSRSGPPIPIEIIKAKGSYIYSKNKKYIDFVCGWNVGNIGWNNPYVIKKLKQFKGPNYVWPNLCYKRWADLAELLAKITPGKLTKTFRSTGGTEAVEVALQSAIRHTGRIKFISVENTYHGHSFGALSVGSSRFRKQLPDLLPGCRKVNPPLNRQAALKVEKLLKTQEFAAYISEPIIMNLGVLMPSKEYYNIISDACKTYGTLLIMDEVASGFGRTGKLFASEHYNLKPDIMTFGKGFTGGYGALGATITTKKVAKAMEHYPTYSTFGWLPLDVEGAIANIEYILKNKLWKKAEIMGKYFEQELKKMNFKQKPDLRLKGLAIGVAFKKPGYAKQIHQRALQKGLLIAENQLFFKMFPPLNLDMRTAKEGLKILSQSL